MSESSPPEKSPRAAFLKGLVGVAFALVGMWWLLSAHRPGFGGREVGTPMPPINAAGWLNGSAPKPGEFDGKVLVIDAWASWCGPCRRQAPEMVLLYEKYHDQGVEFIGLTNETEEMLPDMKRFLKDTGITWKNGYGAEETLMAFGAQAIPMVWVIDRQGTVAWNYGSEISLEAGIRQALAAK